MSEGNEKELLKIYEQYLAYFLDSDMNGINSLVKFPITYIADGECKLLDAFPNKRFLAFKKENRSHTFLKDYKKENNYGILR